MSRRLLTLLAALVMAGPLLVLGGSPAQAIPGPEVLRLWLVDAATDTRLMELTDYQSVDLAFAPQQLTVEAEADGETQSVRFWVDGVLTRTESAVPYALAGDTNGDMAATPRMRQPGWVTIWATPYGQDNAAGAIGPKAVRQLYLRQPDFAVSSTTDRHDGSKGNGSCRPTLQIAAPNAGIVVAAPAQGTLPSATLAKPPGGLATVVPQKTGCSLRAAIEEANALPGRQTISVDGRVGPYELSLGELLITDDVAIYGFHRPVIDAKQRSRALRVAGTAADELLVDLDDLDIANGLVDSTARGGNVSIEAALVQMSNSIVRGGRANFGGGFYLQSGGDLTLTRSVVRDNVGGYPETFGGGGVTNRGGGLFNLRGHVTVRSSSIVDNKAVRGGGLSNFGGTLRVENSSVIGNSAASQGGGIENVDQSGAPASLTVTFSTITNNRAGVSSGDPAALRVGGGIWNDGWAYLANSILAQNTDAFGYWDAQHAPDCYSPTTYDFKDFRNNVVGVLSASCSLTDYSSGNANGIPHGTPQTPLNPGLLARSGAEQVARVPLATSPALDAGSGPSDSLFPCPDTDVRRMPRPAGAGCDAGSAERQ